MARLGVKTVASGLYQVANSEEKRIEIKFDGWLPEVTPIEKFKSKWVKPGLVDWAKGKLRCLLSTELDDLPSTAQDLPSN